MNRYKVAKKVSLIGISGNLFLLLIKAIVGFFTKSQAMIADAFNSAGDIFSSIMTFIGNKIASKPRDEHHNLGYGKAEYIFSIFIAISMAYVSLTLFFKSVISIFKPRTFFFSKFLIVVSCITIILKLILYFYTKKVAKDHNNLLIYANSIDHRNDAILGVGTLIASIGSYFNVYYLDTFVSLIITTWIFISSIHIFIDAYLVLMDKSIDAASLEKVYQIISKYPEVVKVNHFNSTPIGYQYQINFTIFVDGEMSTYKSHEIANKIEKDLMKLETINLAVIHVNPVLNKEE